MARIGFYGGTFNPIHLGHVGVCRQAVRQLRLDCLHVIPAFIPPHKASPDLAAGEDRLAMCRLALQGLPNILADDYELTRGGVSYTIETMRHMRECYPEDDFYLIMGTDNYLTFTAWREWQALGRMCTLAVASREEDDKEALYQQARLLAREGVLSIFLDNPVRVVSSTEIRQMLRAGEPCGDLSPAVAEYIAAHGLYKGGGPMTRQEMREAIRPLMSEERYRHSLGVEKEAERLARRWGEDPEKAAIAGILHDCCKEMPLPEALQIMRRSAIMTEIDFREQPQLIHGFAAAEILGRYGVRDKDIENAVRYHTTGRAGMSRLEKIVYLADLTEEGRHYPDVAEMRRWADRSLDGAMLYALCYTIGKLCRRKSPLCRESWQAYNEYVKFCKEEKE